jgi:hypothetical protein
MGTSSRCGPAWVELDLDPAKRTGPSCVGSNGDVEAPRSGPSGGGRARDDLVEWGLLALLVVAAVRCGMGVGERRNSRCTGEWQVGAGRPDRRAAHRRAPSWPVGRSPRRLAVTGPAPTPRRRCTAGRRRRGGDRPRRGRLGRPPSLGRSPQIGLRAQWRLAIRPSRRTPSLTGSAHPDGALDPPWSRRPTGAAGRPVEISGP